jgi:hypothetical protein
VLKTSEFILLSALSFDITYLCIIEHCFTILLRKSEYSCYTYLVVHKKMFILSFQIEDAMLMFDKQTMRHRGKIVVKAIRRALWVIRIFPQFSSILTIKISSTLFFQHFTLFRLKICFLHFIEEQL